MKKVLAPKRPGRSGALRACAAAAAALLAAGVLAGCAWAREPVPRCGDSQRLAIVAQSVPAASYVPCVLALPPGWRTSGFAPARGETTFVLESDRAVGRPVKVRLAPTCTVGNAPPTTPRADGVLTYMRLVSTSPNYAGTLLDVFSGGCVTYRFNFVRGPHIALMEQFEGAVGLYPRQQLRLDLRKKLGVELGP